MRIWILIIAITIICVGYTIGAVKEVEQKSPITQLISKSIGTLVSLIASLILLYGSTNKGISFSNTNYWFIPVCIGLCLVGDFLLCFLKVFPDIEKYNLLRTLLFIGGMASFLVGYFILGLGSLTVKVSNFYSIWWVIFIPLVLGVIQFFTLKYKELGVMNIPVILYLLMTVVLVAGGIVAYKTFNYAGIFFLVTAIAFYLSDCLIAQKEFGKTNVLGIYMEIPIMLTYAIGHAILIGGCYFLPYAK